MELIRVKTGTCECCEKETEVADVRMQNRTATLCQKDLWKIAKVTLKEEQKVEV